MLRITCLVSLLFAIPAGMQDEGSSETESISQLWNSPGAIRPEKASIKLRDKLELKGQVSGTLTYVAKLGQQVKKEEVVVRLDDDIVQRQLAEAEEKAKQTTLIEFAEIKRDTAEIELKEKQALNDKREGAFTEPEMRRLELDYKQGVAEVTKAKDDQFLAKLAVETKKAEIKQFIRKSEFSGVVTERHLPEGDSVGPGDPILTITNLDVVRAELTVNTSFEKNFKVGDTVLIRRSRRNPGTTVSKAFVSKPATSPVSPGLSSNEIICTGTILVIAPELDTSELRQLTVIADITNHIDGDGRYLLREGQQVEARILGH